MSRDKRRWATPEQRNWLLASFPEYLEAQASGSYTKFWPRFFEDWFKFFPPREPGPNDLTDTELEPDSGPDAPSDSEDDIAPDTAGAKRKRGKSKPKPRKSAKNVSISCEVSSIYSSNI